MHGHRTFFHPPTIGESDFSPLTAGWLLMVRKPFVLIFSRWSFMIFVSGWRPSSSDQGLVLNFPRQNNLNLWYVTMKQNLVDLELLVTMLHSNIPTTVILPLKYLQRFSRELPIKHLVLCTWSHELHIVKKFISTVEENKCATINILKSRSAICTW